VMLPPDWGISDFFNPIHDTVLGSKLLLMRITHA
jgi:hypothetical protein